jgi:hypothetical protein
MKDRQLMVREVEFLRKQIAKSNEEDLEKFLSSNKPLVDHSCFLNIKNILLIIEQKC